VVPFGSRLFGATLVLGNNILNSLIDSICLSVYLSILEEPICILYAFSVPAEIINLTNERREGGIGEGGREGVIFCISLTKCLDSQCHLQLHCCTK
jgi:hypothetical protein